MADEVFDIAIIGAGPGGYVAAIRAAQLQQRVLLIEKERVGGVCLNWGCIPTKGLLKSARVADTVRHAADYGIMAGAPTIDFPKVMERAIGSAGQIAAGVDFLLKKNRITVVKGQGKLKSPSSIEVAGVLYQARHIILATGARPRTFPNLPVDGKGVLFSNHVLALRERPARLAIIGAGAIGVEFADFFHAMGTKVSLIEAQANILPLEDREVSQTLERCFKKKGISLHTGAMVRSIVAGETGQRVHFRVNEGPEETVEADRVLVAVGVAPNSEDLGLGECGITTKNGFVVHDEFYETSAKGVFVIGDLSGPPLLAHTASHEGVGVVENIVHPTRRQAIAVFPFPGCTYCSPQVASIGKTEEMLQKEGIPYKVGKFFFKASGKAKAVGETDGFVKILFDPEIGTIHGAHIIGEEATELLPEIALAMKVEAGVGEIGSVIHAHPTLAESIMEAALAFGEGPIHA